METGVPSFQPHIQFTVLLTDRPRHCPKSKAYQRPSCKYAKAVTLLKPPDMASLDLSQVSSASLGAQTARQLCVLS